MLEEIHGLRFDDYAGLMEDGRGELRAGFLGCIGFEMSAALYALEQDPPDLDVAARELRIVMARLAFMHEPSIDLELICNGFRANERMLVELAQHTERGPDTTDSWDRSSPQAPSDI